VSNAELEINSADGTPDDHIGNSSFSHCLPSLDSVSAFGTSCPISDDRLLMGEVDRTAHVDIEEIRSCVGIFNCDVNHEEDVNTSNRSQVWVISEV
jgi:hypothetical protein